MMNLKKLNECETCEHRSICVRSDYEYAKIFECQKFKKAAKKKRRKKMIFKLLCTLIMLSLAGVVFAVIYLSILKSAKEDFASDEPESVYDSVEIKEVPLDDIPNDPEIEQPIEEWATKKDEEYINDISETYPEEVVEEAKEALTEQEIGYLEEDAKAVEEVQIPISAEKDIQEIKDEVKAVENAAEELGDVILDISLPKELQIHTQECCKTYGVPYAVVLALMESESSFRGDIGNEFILGGDESAHYYGYMQLSADNCNKASSTYALDAHKPEGNIEMAIILLSGYLQDYDGDVEKAIMAYKGGKGYADQMISAGKTSSAAEKVATRAEYYDILIKEIEE